MLTRTIRVSSLVVAVVILVGLLAACEDDEVVQEFRDSPAPPAPAPAELIAQVATNPLVGGSEVDSGSGGDTEITEGTNVSVNLQDLGGSGIYSFSPGEFTFSAGEAVIFTFTSETEFHTFTVTGLGIDAQIESGETTTLGFVFSEPGVYNLICVPHETLGMVGTITVQ